MRGIWARRLIPAAVVSVVLAFSYIAPAVGLDVAPVKHFDQPNCGRNGYGYHGGKNNLTCPSPHPPPVITPAVVQAAPAAKPQAPPPASASASPAVHSTAPSSRLVIDAPVFAGVSQWRVFIELLRRQLAG